MIITDLEDLSLDVLFLSLNERQWRALFYLMGKEPSNSLLKKEKLLRQILEMRKNIEKFISDFQMPKKEQEPL